MMHSLISRRGRSRGTAFRSLLALVSLSAILSAQETRPADDATWKGGIPVAAGAVAAVGDVVVPVDLFLEEIVRRYARPDMPSIKVLENLVNETMVRTAAEKAGVEVTEADVERRYEELARQIKQADPKLDLAEQIRKQGVSMETFRKKLRSNCVLERLARIDQRIPEAEPVTAKHQNTWLANRRKEAAVELDLEKLPPGTVALVDGSSITYRDFARDFLQTADKSEIRRLVDMLARSVLMDDVLAARKLPLADADLDQELAARKTDFESKPQYQGLSFTDIVKQTTGLEADRWKRTRGFRLEAGYSKLGRHAAMKDEVQAYYEQNLSFFGPRYTVRHLLIRGAEHPETWKGAGPAPQPIAKARVQAEVVAAEIRKGKRFEDLVQLYSEDTATKLSGGVLEPFTPGDSRLHESFTKAVQSLEVGQTSPPVESPAGVHLIRLDRKDPPPPVDAVEALIRRELGLRRFREAWNAARYGVDVKLD